MKRVWVDKDRCLGCKTCELQCAIERNSASRTLAGAGQESPKPVARVGVFGATGRSFPIQCRHCDDAVCVKACPSGAMQSHPEKGNIFVDQAKCRACWMCVMTCPFGAVIPSGAFKAAIKCDACMHMEEPACVSSCPTGALLYGDEASYDEVLARRRNRIAAWAVSADARIIGLDLMREGK
jgi:carbon-monoxide dehydrogenase iron sulfur subunit